MDKQLSLMPVPADVSVSDKLNREKISRKFKTVFFVFFVLYFVSTLLGAALVPGRLDIDSVAFMQSISENGVSLFCAERCFFALFLFFSGFSFLRYPVSLLALTCAGVFTGICIKLLMYEYGFFCSLFLATFTACLVLMDIFAFSFCFYYVYPAKKNAHSIILNVSVYIVYIALSFLFSYLITLLF